MRRAKRRGKGSSARPWRLGPTQREVICDVMRSAAECNTWLTLRELARLTRYGEASISAQLRHLRKPHCGGFAVEKRPRECEDGTSVLRVARVWEYRVRLAARKRKLSN